MTQHINSAWKENHVGGAGVTCYTCHRGQPVPANIWFTDPGPNRPGGFIARNNGQNMAAPSVGLASLPYDTLTEYLADKTIDNNAIRVNATTALPTTKGKPIQDAEKTYGADDPHVGVARGQLHLLPQHPRDLELVAEHAAADHRLARHPDGAGPQRQLPRAAALDLPAEPPRRAGRRAEGQLRHLPQRREQAPERRARDRRLSRNSRKSTETASARRSQAARVTAIARSAPISPRCPPRRRNRPAAAPIGRETPPGQASRAAFRRSGTISAERRVSSRRDRPTSWRRGRRSHRRSSCRRDSRRRPSWCPGPCAFGFFSHSCRLASSQVIPEPLRAAE